MFTSQWSAELVHISVHTLAVHLRRFLPAGSPQQFPHSRYLRFEPHNLREVKPSGLAHSRNISRVSHSSLLSNKLPALSRASSFLKLESVRLSQASSFYTLRHVHKLLASSQAFSFQLESVRLSHKLRQVLVVYFQQDQATSKTMSSTLLYPWARGHRF